MSAVFVLYTDFLDEQTFADEWANYLACLDITYGDKEVSGKFSVVENLPDFPGIVAYVVNFESTTIHTDEVFLIFEIKGMPVENMADLVTQDDPSVYTRVFGHSVGLHSTHQIFGGINRVYYNQEQGWITVVTNTGADYYREQITACLRKGLKAV